MFRKLDLRSCHLTKSMLPESNGVFRNELEGLVQEKILIHSFDDGLSVLRMPSLKKYFRKWIYDHETRLNRCS